MTYKPRVDKGIILAAGDGDRLGELTESCPKVLLPVQDNIPLIRYPIEAMAAVGINEIMIVVGYLGNKVKEELDNGNQFDVRLKYTSNPDYLGGNAISVHKARDWARGETVVLCMGDHLIEREVVKRLLEDTKTANETLCVDYAPAEHHEVAEATKVALDGSGCIEDIGKDLVYWDALDTGVFLLTDNFFRALDELVHQYGIDVEISDVVRFLISQGYCFNTCDASGCFWLDVDTEEDLKTARV